MINLRILSALWALATLGMAFGAVPAFGQHLFTAPSSTAEVNRELHRAELAWRSGGSLLEAKARLDRVLRSHPDHAPARKLRAHVLIGLARPEAALTDARRAVELAPDAEALLLVTEAARLSGRDGEARTALDRVGGQAFHDAALHVRLAWNAAELGLLEQAEAFARIALQQDAALPGAYVQLARIFVQQDEEAAAASVIVRGLTLGVLDGEALAADALLLPLLRHPDVAPLVR